VSRALIGHARTRARAALASLSAAHPDAADLARLLGMRRHTIEALLDRRMLPGPRFAYAVSCLAII